MKTNTVFIEMKTNCLTFAQVFANLGNFGEGYSHHLRHHRLLRPFLLCQAKHLPFNFGAVQRWATPFRPLKSRPEDGGEAIAPRQVPAD